jgi:hypothetical protein
MTSALNGREWSALRPGCLTPGKKPLVPTGQESGWASEMPKRCGTQRNFLPCRESNPGRPACSPLLYQLIYPGSYSLHIIVAHYYSLFSEYHPDATQSIVQATAEARPNTFSGTLCTNTGRRYPANGKTREHFFMEHDNACIRISIFVNQCYS